MCVQAVENLGLENPVGKNTIEKFSLSVILDRNLLNIGLITFVNHVGSHINDQFLFRKKGNVLLSNPHSCEKREPSNHLPTNIFDILLGIWYLWLLYRVHLGLLRDRTTFTPYAVPIYTAGSLFQAMWRNTYEQASQVICFISPPLGTRMVR